MSQNSSASASHGSGASEEPVLEGTPAQITKIAYEGNRIPVPLLVAWLILFAWIIGYAVQYLIPALPK